MNAITDHAADAVAQASAASPPSARFTLRRNGRKPVRFTGWKLVEAVGSAQAAPLFYDLAVYRATGGQCVAELIARRAGLQGADLCRVESFTSLEPLTAWLEAFDPTQDVPVPPTLCNEDHPLPQAVLCAVRLREMMARVAEEYQDMLSDVFEALDQCDPPEPAA